MFNPSDARQVYCCEQHRIDNNNDNRKLKYENAIAVSRIFSKNEEVLRTFYNNPKFNRESAVQKNFLEILGYDFSRFTEVKINQQTKGLVHWNFLLGIEGADPTVENFFIRNRKTI